MAEVNAANEKEMEQMQGFLQAKIEKNLNLEMQLDELRDAYLSLE